MFWLRLFNSMAAAIPTMLAGGEDFFDLIGCAAACRMASKVGALVLSSVMTFSHLKSVILFSEDTRSTEGTGLSRQSEPHSTLMIWRMIYSHSIVLNMYYRLGKFIFTFRISCSVASFKAGVLRHVRAV